MKRSMNLMTVVGVVLAVVAGIAIYVVLGRHAATQQVLVATTTIPQYSAITSADVALATEQAADVPPNTLFAPSQAVGRFATTTLYPGQVLIAQAVATSNAGGSSGLLAALGPNVRAYSISANVADAIAGNIAVGDKVDVIATLSSSGGGGGLSGGSSNSGGAITVVQHVTVLSVATSSGSVVASNPGAAPSAASSSSSTQNQQPAAIYTLALTPAQVQLVALASQSGTLSLALDPVSGATTYTSGPVLPLALNGAPSIGPSVKLQTGAKGARG
jgi:Flp pilus assembly protein CpaB